NSNTCRCCEAAASIEWTTGTLLTGWCGSRARLKTTATARSCSPTSRFRMTWDALRETVPLRANKRYLEVLELAAKEGEARVDEALRCLLEQGEMGEGKLNAETVRALLNEAAALPPATAIGVAPVSLAAFDELLGGAP